LLTECTRPSIIGFTIQNVSCDFIPEDGLAQLVDVRIPVVLDEVVRAVDLVHLTQEAFESFHQCSICRSGLQV
jgi:hypothetical protein